jgi:hypothetical protein
VRSIQKSPTLCVDAGASSGNAVSLPIVKDPAATNTIPACGDELAGAGPHAAAELDATAGVAARSQAESISAAMTPAPSAAQRINR